MKTRAKGAQVQKAGKAPDPGAYSADDITPEDRKRAKDAKAQAADGTNPPSWVSDEETWSRAKEAADKTYDEGDDAYWPAVVHIYGNMGGEIQAASKKAEHHHADMANVVGMMSEHEMSESDMVEISGLDAARVKALLHGGEKPTVDELAAMTDACAEYEESEVEKHGDHDQASHGDRGFSSVGSFAGSVADRIGEKYPSAAGSLRDASDALRAAHDYESKGDSKKAKDNARNAGRSLREARNALRGTGSAEDEDVESMMNDVKEYAASMGKSVSPESVLKAGLGMSDGEFRRMLGQAVYARWGKQAAVDEVFPETQVALVKAWEGEAWMSGFRLLSVPYDAEDGAVTLGEVSGEVRQTYEPIAKSADVEPDNASCEVEYVADRDKRGEYVISGLNGEAVTLAKSLSDAGVPARIEDGDVVFASRGAVCKQLTIRATVEGEFDPGPRSFIPYLRDEVSMRKAEEKGIVYGIVYEPDVVDKQGEWATADDIEEAAHEYLKRSRRMKRQHDEHSDSEVVESYIAPADFFFGNRMVRKGSWVVAEQLGEKSKKLYKEGKLTGFSMGGHASYAA